jgi:integrase
MRRKRKPQDASDGDTPLTPITSKERRDLDKSIKKKYDRHLIPRFGGHRLCDISRVEVQQYLLEKLKQGFAWETTNHLRHLLSKVMGTAVNWEYVLNNPVRGVKMPERTLKRPHRFLTAEEVRRLIAASNEPLRTIIILATMTGLRIGEILALRWGRIDLLCGTLRVAETCYKGHFGFTENTSQPT